MLQDKGVGLTIARGGEPIFDLVLCLGITLERDVMKRGGRHFRSEEFSILGLLELEEGCRAAVADPEEAMTIGSHRTEQLVRLAPRGNQRNAEQILVKSSCSLKIPGDVSGVVEPARNFELNVHYALSIGLLRRPARLCA